MSEFRVLIVGGGIAGAVAAYWLGKAGAQVIVIEAVAELRKSGQGVDVRGKGVEVIRKMGVEEQIRSRTTKEAGMAFVDDKNQQWCAFDVSEDTVSQGDGFTSEIEIMRKDLSEILYDAANAFPHVTFQFGCSVSGTTETSTGISVSMSDGKEQEFDVIIGADGLGSKTRKLMLDATESKAAIYSLGFYVCYFSMKRQEQDGPRARWYNAPGRRTALIRPKNDKEASGYLTVMQDTPALRSAFETGDQQKQKQLFKDIFSDAGWECPRMISEMEASQDFYYQYLAQVRLPPSSWHRGRSVLVGDAASCPSPLTGMGTTVAIVGAYILACELGQELKRTQMGQQVDHQAAFERYADLFSPYVKKAQSIPLGGYLPALVNPETWWGIRILRTLLWLVQLSGLLKLVEKFAAQPPADKFEMPAYEI